MTKKTTLLFDLGGVIVPWVGIEALMKKAGKNREDILKTLSESDIFNAYETGQCYDSQFLTEMITLFDYDIYKSEFSSLWNSWVKPPFAGIIDELNKLRRNYTLACLSNTNPLHWAHLKTMIDLETVFDYSFASHLIGVAKPEPESYTIPLKLMNIKAENVIFFDDTTANIEAAKELGIKAYLVDRRFGVLPTLRNVFGENI